jgi:hypothetical protein
MNLLNYLQTGREIPFAEFWRRYLDAHRRPGTRAAHYAATALGIVSALAALYFGQVGFMLGGIALSYALAIGSHKFIENNRPLIRVNALYGAFADLKMCWLALTGGLSQEFERLGLTDWVNH